MNKTKKAVNKFFSLALFLSSSFVMADDYSFEDYKSDYVTISGLLPTLNRKCSEGDQSSCKESNSIVNIMSNHPALMKEIKSGSISGKAMQAAWEGYIAEKSSGE